MTKPKWLIAALVIAAAIIPLLVFRYGFNPYRCTGDYCVDDRTVWGKHTEIRGKPFPMRNQHTGELVLEDGKPIMLTPVREGRIGIVIRDSFSLIAGLIGGLIVPLLLLIAAAAIGARTAFKSSLKV